LSIRVMHGGQRDARSCTMRDKCPCRQGG
jgi:hypothetical protein